MNWKRKLGSRKFWALIAGLATSWIVGVGMMMGYTETELANIIGGVTTIVGSTGSVAVYVLAEASVDKTKR